MLVNDCGMVPRVGKQCWYCVTGWQTVLTWGYVAWENRRLFATPLMVSSQNDVWGTSGEIPYWWLPRSEKCFWLVEANFQILYIDYGGGFLWLVIEFLFTLIRSMLKSRRWRKNLKERELFYSWTNSNAGSEFWEGIHATRTVTLFFFLVMF